MTNQRNATDATDRRQNTSVCRFEGGGGGENERFKGGGENERFKGVAGGENADLSAVVGSAVVGRRRRRECKFKH